MKIRFVLLLNILLASTICHAQTVPTPSITVIGSATFCPPSGRGPILISSAGSGNLWSNGATTQTVFANTSGSYWVTQTVGNTTSAPSAVIQVSMHPLPSATLVPLSGPLCIDAPPVQLQGLPSGGYFSGPGLSGSTFNPATANLGPTNVIHYTYYQLFGNDYCSDTASTRITVLDCYTSLEEQDAEASVIIRPHALPGRFIVEAGGMPLTSLRVMDLQGKQLLILDPHAQSKAEFDLGIYQTGIYIAELQLSHHCVRKRFIKAE